MSDENYWENEARRYAANADYWRDRTEESQRAHADASANWERLQMDTVRDRDRLAAEVERLTKERDEARADYQGAIALKSRIADGMRNVESERDAAIARAERLDADRQLGMRRIADLTKRAEAAESDLERLTSEVESVRLQLQAAQGDAGFWGRATARQQARAEAAEAELARCREERDELRASIATAREAHGDPMTAAILDIVRKEAEADTAEKIAAWCEAPCPCDEPDCEAKYRALAAAIRRGDWRKEPDHG